MNCKKMIYVENVGGLVPCGRCHHCRINRRNKKTGRLALEGIDHEDTLFVTLTYSKDYLPTDLYDPKTGQVIASHPLGCLDKRAIVLFNKRLRFNSKRKLRIYYCGEYGENKGRPHYHLIIWGLPYSERHHIFKSWTDPHTGKLMCDPDYLDIQIPKSSHDVSQYCNAYILKGQTSEKSAKKYLEGRPPEFSNGSKGLGKSAIDRIVSGLKTPSGQDFIEREADIPRTFMLGGKSYPIDRYLKGKIIDALGISEKVTATGLTKYQTEMQALHERAKANPEIPRHEKWSTSPRGKAQLMSKQHHLENAAKLAASERRFNLNTSKKGEF